MVYENYMFIRLNNLYFETSYRPAKLPKILFKIDRKFLVFSPNIAIMRSFPKENLGGARYNQT